MRKEANDSEAPSALEGTYVVTRRPVGTRKGESLTAASLFCGVGGLDFGFHRAGVEIVRAFDLDPDAVSTYANFYGHKPEHIDVRALTKNDLKGIGIAIAGPPCQGFSSIATRIPRDPRNSLILTSAKLIAEAQPNAFVIENVMGLKWHADGRFFKKTLKLLRAAGLDAEGFVVECSNLGIPQRRKRILIVGAQRKYSEQIFKNMRSTLESRVQPTSVWESLKSLPPLGSIANHLYEDAFPRWYTNVIEKIGPGQKLCDTRLGPSAIHSWEIPSVFGATTPMERKLLTTLVSMRRWTANRRYQHIGDGKPVKLESIAYALGISVREAKRISIQLEEKEFLKKCRSGYIDLARRFNGRFKRLPVDGFAPAVLNEFSSPRNMLHPIENRGLTVRECARLQTFPDSFEFFGSQARQFQLVANAFPPAASQRIAFAIVNGLRGRDV